MAANPGLMKKVIFDLPVVANVHCATGRDGADGKLLDAVTPHTIATRYDRLVIGSGDGIFMPHARTVAHGGVAVEVVARPDGCARTLHRFHCTFLEPVHTRDDIDRATDVVLAA